MAGHSISKTNGNVEIGKLKMIMSLVGEAVRDDEWTTIDNLCFRSMVIPWGICTCIYIVYRECCTTICMTRSRCLVVELDRGFR